MSEREQLNVTAGAIIVIGVFAGAAILVLWGGWVFHVLWNWFAPPFTDVRLSWAQAVGLSCLLSVLRGMRYRKTEGETGEALTHALIAPALLLLIGWLAALSMGIA
jgi:hypothetical protein